MWQATASCWSHQLYTRGISNFWVKFSTSLQRIDFLGCEKSKLFSVLKTWVMRKQTISFVKPKLLSMKQKIAVLGEKISNFIFLKIYLDNHISFYGRFCLPQKSVLIWRLAYDLLLSNYWNLVQQSAVSVDLRVGHI